MKIAKMEDLVANCRIIDESKLDNSKVLILSKVRIRNTGNNSEMSYTLVAENEADLRAGKISISSPIAKALLGKKVGDKVEAQVPSGKVNLEILDISR
jgi:transcription elongation factor GreA